MVMYKAFFKSMKQANEFILNKDLKHNILGRIPYNHLESQGIIRAPIELSEEDLLLKLNSSVDIIGVKRFLKKREDGNFHPLSTVLVTFLASQRPDHVTYEHIWFDTQEYIKPLLQCYTCYKFGHGRGSCKNKQVCSICAGEHYYKDCKNKENNKCINCSGSHIAVSNSCPIKMAKISQIKDKVKGKVTYATTVKNASSLVNQQSPASVSNTSTNTLNFISPQKRVLVAEIVNSDVILNTITKTVVDIIRKVTSTLSTLLGGVEKMTKEVVTRHSLDGPPKSRQKTAGGQHRCEQFRGAEKCAALSPKLLAT
ncbi:LOW QUALITY PROTEIN: uncharacterized protein ACR2FA_007269 [Aphomia sociella]